MSESKRVLIIRSNPVDPDPRVEKEAATLIEAGYLVDIFCWDRSSDHSVIKSEKQVGNGTCCVYRVGIEASFGAGFRKNLIPLLRFQIEIIRFLTVYGDNYDVLHACDFDTAFAGFIASRGKHIHFVYDIFDYYADAFSVPRVMRKFIVWLDTIIMNNADAVIICSEQRIRQIRGARPKKLTVIHNAPSMRLLHSGESRPEGEAFRIAYVGILNDGRLIPELLELVSQHPEYELHIAGFGKYEDLACRYATTNKNIIFYGKVEYDRALEIESNSDVMMAVYDPSIKNHVYAAPNKFYEALMLGKPVIMCKGTGLSDIVESNGFGEVIDYTAASLIKGLERIKSRQPDIVETALREKDLFKRQYSWEIMAYRLKELYDSL